MMRVFPWIIGVVLLAVVAMAVFWPQPSARPNVLLVTIDTLRADHVAAYGHPLARTPTLDALAAEGTLFEEALTSAPITLPAHTTLMSGLLPPSHGVRDNGAYAVPEAVDLMAERLSRAGYETQAFVSAVVLAKRYNLLQGFDGYDDALWSEEDPKLFMIRERQARDTIDRVLSWFASRPSERNTKPFFAFVHLFDPHEPHRAPGDIAASAPTPYDAEITYADQQLGRLIEALRSSGTLDDTLIIVTADHGESLGEHDEKTHAVFVYRATTHVPLIVRQPGRFPAARRVQTPVHHIDVLPTVLASLSLPADKLPGRDLRSFLAEPGNDRALYSESLLAELGFGMAPLYAIREKGFTYIDAPRPELYDLSIDPDETVNRIALPAYQAQANNLPLSLDAVKAEAERQSFGAVANPLSAESIEMLQSLGYLQPAASRDAVSGMDPKDGIRIYNRLEGARRAAQQQNWTKSEAMARSILDELPKHASARGVLATSLIQQERFDDARHEYLQLIADNPQEFRVLAMLGHLGVRTGDHVDARRHFDAALRVAPTFIEARAGLALLAMIEGDLAEADRQLAKVLAIDPEFPGAHRLMGDRWYGLGEYGKALAEYEQTLKAQPDDFRTLLQAAASARRAGAGDRARILLDRAIELRPEHYVPHYNRACLIAVTSGLAAALPDLDAALALEPAIAGVIAIDPDWAAFLTAPELKSRMTVKSPRRPREKKAPGE